MKSKLHQDARRRNRPHRRARVHAAGHAWGWEDQPPKAPRKKKNANHPDLPQFLCTSCIAQAPEQIATNITTLTP